MAANVFQPVELRRIRPKKIEGRRDAKWFLLRLQECDRRSAARRRRTRFEVRIEAAGEYGEIACRWSLDGGVFTLSVQAPPNTSATVLIPERLGQAVRVDGVAAVDGTRVPGVRAIARSAEGTLIEIGAGAYTFTVSVQLSAISR